MNQSPEARLLTRYAMTIALGIVALIIGPRAFGHGFFFTAVLLAAAAIVTRIVYATPLRFAHRNATPRLRAVWYVFLAEVVLAALAYALAFHRHGSFAGSVAALAAMAALELAATRLQHAEYVRIGVILQPAPGASSDDDLAPFTGEAVGAENDALKNALADVYAHVPTAVRAYLLMRSAADGSAQRVLALRYAYPWVDEDAVRVAFHIFQRMAAPGETMNVIALDDRSEARARAVANPFYERANGGSPAP